MDPIRAAAAADLPGVIKLANAIFIPEGSNSARMEEKFPLFFSEKNLARLLIATDGDKIISHVGLYPSKIIVEGATLTVGSIGSVCTHPEYRGKGIASRILDVVEENARRDGLDLLLVSGERSLYLRRQCVQVGNMIECRVARAQPDQASSVTGVHLVEYDPGWFQTMVSLYAREPVRFYRTRDEFGPLLDAGLRPFYNWTIKAYMVEDRQSPSAYFIMSIGNEWADIAEYAGDRGLLRSAFQQALAKESLSQIRMMLSPGDALIGLLQGPGSTQKPSSQLGTVKILNAMSLLESLRPYFLQHVPAAIMDGLDWVEENGQIALIAAGERLVFEDPTVLTHLIFGFEESAPCPAAITDFLSRHPAVDQFVSSVFPVPLPWAGNLNFI